MSTLARIAAAFQIPESSRPIFAPDTPGLVVLASVVCRDGSLVETLEDDRPLGPSGRGEGCRYAVRRLRDGDVIDIEATDSAGDARILAEYLVDRGGGMALAFLPA